MFAYWHRLSDLSPSVDLHVYIIKTWIDTQKSRVLFFHLFIEEKLYLFVHCTHYFFFLLNSVSLRWFYVSIFISISPFLTSSSISCLFPVPFIYKAIGSSSIWSNNFSEDSPIHVLSLCLKYVSLSSILIIHPFISSFYTVFDTYYVSATLPAVEDSIVNPKLLLHKI